MSTARNVAQILAASPTTSIGNNDTFYLAKNNSSDAAISGTNLLNATSAAAATYIQNTGVYAPSVGSANYAPPTGSPNYLKPNSNLSDVASVPVARTNLGLGSAALNNTGDFAPSSGSSVYATQASLANYAPATGSTQYAPANGSPNYAPATGSTAYAPATGSSVYATQAALANYAPATGSTAYAPATGSTNYLQVDNNLDDLEDIGQARTNLGLGSAATSASTAFAPATGSLNYAPISGSMNYAPYSGSTNYLNVSNNLSDLGSASSARTNLGLGTAATANSTAFAPATGSTAYANTTGTNATGSWPISVTGSAATAGSATTAANLANLAGSTLYGNSSTSTGTGAAITLGTGLSFTGSALNVTFPPSSGTIDSGTAGQLGYYAAAGTELSGLTLGMNLSITSGVLNAATGNPMLTAGDIFVGNAQNSATPVTMSGDATITQAGVVTVSHATNADNAQQAVNAGTATTAANLSALQASSLYGNPTTSTNTGEPITLGSGLFFQGTTLNATAELSTSLPSGDILVGNASGVASPVSMSGDATIDNTGKVTVSHAALADSATTATSATSATTAANLTNLAASTLYGNPTTSAATGEGITLGTGLSFTGTVLNVAIPNNGKVDTGTAGALGYYQAATAEISPLTLGTNLSITNGTLNAATGTPMLMSGYVFVGNAQNSATGVAMSGDATITSAGVVTVSHATASNTATSATSATTAGSISSVAASSLLGNSTTSAANSQPISLGTGLSFSGTTLNVMFPPSTGTVDTGAAGSLAYYSAATPEVGPLALGTGLSITSGTLNYVPGISTALAAGKIIVGNASGVAASVALSGDASITSTGAIAVSHATQADSATTANSALLANNIASLPSATLYGNPQGSTQTGETITLGTGLSFTGSQANGYALTVSFPPSTGTVNSGTTNQLGYYPSNGTALSGLTLGTGLSVTSGTLNYVQGVSTSLASGNILVGNSTGTATPVTVSGNGTLSNTGVLTVTQATNATTANSATTAGSATTAANLTGLNASSLYGNSAATSGTGGNIALGTGLSFTGSTLNVTFPVNNSVVNSGTANQIAIYPTAGTAVSGASTLPTAVQGNITQVGTLTAGTWNGGLITGTYGGTGVNNGANTLTLAANTAFSGAFATTITSTATTNATLPAGTVTLATNTGSNASGTWPISITGSSATATSSTTSANLTGLAASTLYGNPTTASATGTGITLGTGLSFSGSVLNATVGVSTALPSGQIYVGNGSGVATPVTVSGNGTLSNAGVLTVTQAANATTAGSASSATTAGTAGNLTGLAASTLYGNPTSSSATGTTITLGTGLSFTGSVLNAVVGVSTSLPSGQIYVGNSGGTATAVAMSGNATLSNTGVITVSQAANATTANTATSATTAANLTGLTASTLYGNPTGSSATGTGITLGTGLAFSGGALTATGGTVSTGTTNALGYYTAANNTINPLTTLVNSMLTTNSSGVPSWYQASTIGAFLQSQNNLPPAYSAYTFPVGNLTQNSLLFASSTTAVSQVAPVNSGVVVTSSAGVPSVSTTVPAVNLTANVTGVGSPVGTRGEVIKNVVKATSAVAYTGSGSITYLTVINVTPGDWDIWGNISITVGGGAIISATAAVSQSGSSIPDTSIITQMYSGNGNGNTGLVIVPQPTLVTNTTPFYLVFTIVYNTLPTTLTVCGGIYARRA